LTVPPIQLNIWDPDDPLDKFLLAARKANSTAICLLRISLTDKISKSVSTAPKLQNFLEVQIKMLGRAYTSYSTLSTSTR
jgi:hypothetical protein